MRSRSQSGGETAPFPAPTVGPKPGLQPTVLRGLCAPGDVLPRLKAVVGTEGDSDGNSGVCGRHDCCSQSRSTLSQLPGTCAVPQSLEARPGGLFSGFLSG